MNKKYFEIWSERLGKKVAIAQYGHYGLAAALFPFVGDNPLEVEENGFVDSIAHILESGKLTVFAIETANFNSWLSSDLPNEEKSRNHYLFNEFVINEALPFIFGQMGGASPAITAGAALGGYHAANLFFKRPDLFIGTAVADATFDIKHFTGGYYDENCYFNSPVDFLPNLEDEYWLAYLRKTKRLILTTGTGEGTSPENVRRMSDILKRKGIPHEVEYWGEEWKREPKSWIEQLKRAFERKI